MNFSKLIAALVAVSMIHANTSLPPITYVDVHPDEYLKLDCHFIQTVGDSWVPSDGVDRDSGGESGHLLKCLFWP